MSDVYAMQRANGDCFVFADNGRLRVPLFHSIHDAMMARLRNSGMMLFQPVILDDRLLKEIAPTEKGSKVDLCIISDPFTPLSRGSLVKRAELFAK